MAAKFDSNRAWTGATKMLSANLNVVAIVAGVFFFLPNLAIMLVAPELADPFAAGPPAQSGEEAMAQLSALGPGFFAAVIAIGLIQAVGVLGLLCLLTDREKPTVGEALTRGLRGLLPYLLAQIIQALLFVLLIGLPFALVLASGNAGLIFGGSVLAIAAGIFLFVRFSLLSPAIAIDGIQNPVNALRRSWNLTAGMVGRLTFFFFLLMLAITIVFMVASLVFGLIFALLGEDVAAVGQALLGAAVNALFVTIFLGVVASIHRQLAATGHEGA